MRNLTGDMIVAPADLLRNHLIEFFGIELLRNMKAVG
jgi:hypothetical protein